jgi:hypothetical protein
VRDEGLAGGSRLAERGGEAMAPSQHRHGTFAFRIGAVCPRSETAEGTFKIVLPALQPDPGSEPER